MKSLKLLCCIALVFAVASCKDVNRNLEEMVPETATGVLCVNIAHLLEKAGMNADNNYQIPAQLVHVISRNDESTFGRWVSLLPKAGINLESNSYIFFSKGVFRCVGLVSVADENVLKTLIERETGMRFAEVAGVEFLRSDATTFAIGEGTLLIGQETRETEDTRLAASAKSILTKQAKSLFDDAEVKSCFAEEADLSLYIKVKGLKAFLNAIPAFSTLEGSMPLLSILTDSDAEAFTASVTFGADSAAIEAKIKADEKSDFCKLLNITLSSPDNAFLRAIPTSMRYVATVSVDGENLMKLEQIRKSVNLLSNLPGMESLDFREIVKSINGPLVVALAPGYMSNLSLSAGDDLNVTIAIKSKDPEGVVDKIRQFAREKGQPDYLKDGRYVYNYRDKPVYVGTAGQFVYVCRLDHEWIEDSFYEYPEYRQQFETCKAGFFVLNEYDTLQTLTSFGFDNNLSGRGMFLAFNEGQNPVVAFVSLLCSIAPEPAASTAEDSL